MSCRIEDHTDIVALTVRVNGTVTIRTVAEGCVLNTISAQANKQDYSTGGPSPLNKSLVESATREVLGQLCQRAVQPIEDAVVGEMFTREKIVKAEGFLRQDKYEDALSALMTITRDSPHYSCLPPFAEQYQIEKEAFKLIATSKAESQRGHYRAAIADLRQVNPKSKRYRLAQSMIASLSHPTTLAKNKSKPASGTASRLKRSIEGAGSPEARPGC